jgi:glycosyltransferase involved in cell wall biosynthesis
MPTISYAITACNEHVELKRLLDQIESFITADDEIVVQLDNTYTAEVWEVVQHYNVGRLYQFHRIVHGLSKDFAAFKNNLMQHCTKDYVFFIDADEYLADGLVSDLKLILVDNPDVDCYAIPRINTVKGLTSEHINKWGWHVNEAGWVNYPDYQTRICKNDKSIVWSGKVHERLIGWKTGSHLPAEYTDYSLIHPKTIDRQEKQNQLYSNI